MLTQKHTWLITGGAGFIGSHLAKELVRRGQHVRVFDNFSSGSEGNLCEIKNDIEFIQGDIRDYSALLKACQGADFVSHHAALVSVPQSIRQPRETMEINVQGTVNLLEAARQNKVRRVVFASSCAIYGDAQKAALFTEQSPFKGKSPYAVSKYAGSGLCRLYTQLFNLPTVSLVYFNVFGPGQRFDSPYAAVIARFLHQAAAGEPIYINGDGTQTRDFISVQDIVQANLLAFEKAAPGQTYNVGSGKTYSLLQLADFIEQISARPLKRIFRPEREGDILFSAADISKIQALGFCPSLSLQQALQTMWQALKSR